MLYGPNTNVGSNSVIFVLEAQARYIVRALRYLRRRRKTYVAVQPAAMASFLAKIDQWMQGTVWTTQCSNYFRAANGRVVTQWPRSARAFWGMTRRFKAADFTFEPPCRRSNRACSMGDGDDGIGWLGWLGAARSRAAWRCDSRTEFLAACGQAHARAVQRPPPRSGHTCRRLRRTDRRPHGAGPRRRACRCVSTAAASTEPAPVVVFCHAGGFVLGNLDTDHRQCVELARRGRCTVVSVDYRLSPEHPYPAALDDATAVLRWVAANATELGVDAARIAVAGSSAGAALAACLAQRSRRRDTAGGRLPAAAPAGARRSGNPIEGGVPQQPRFRQRGSGTDVASLPGPRRRISGRRARPATTDWPVCQLL